MNKYDDLLSRAKMFYDQPMVGELMNAVRELKKRPDVVRCGECIYYHKAHVLCKDGTEKDFSEFPQEAFGLLGCGVTAEYGINVGGKCELDTNRGYEVDKSVFRQPNDFCRYGKRRSNDA